MKPKKKTDKDYYGGLVDCHPHPDYWENEKYMAYNRAIAMPETHRLLIDAFKNAYNQAINDFNAWLVSAECRVQVFDVLFKDGILRTHYEPEQITFLAKAICSALTRG